MPAEGAPSLVPRGWSGRVSCLMLVCLPTLGLLLLAGWWMLKQKQLMDSVQQKNAVIQDQVLQIGRLIMDFNLERELTVIYVTARNMESQATAREDLDMARRYTDQSLAQLRYWPGGRADGHLLKSRYLFSAVLGRHRSLVKVGSHFIDELFFYSDVIDVFFGWLHREFQVLGTHAAWQWLLSYSYLLGSISYLGAEQALCSVYYSVICLSHRETFHYANYSFSGEAAFRMYRQTYPERRDDLTWTKRGHRTFFPELFACREEIFADMNYQGVSIDPSLCDYSRKNETRFHDTDVLILQESSVVTARILELSRAAADRAVLAFLVSAALLGGGVCYLLLGHVTRCVGVRCAQARRLPGYRRAGSAHSHSEEDTKQELTDHVAMNSTGHVVRYDDYGRTGNYVHSNHHNHSSLQRPLKPIINSKPSALKPDV